MSLALNKNCRNYLFLFLFFLKMLWLVCQINTLPPLVMASSRYDAVTVKICGANRLSNTEISLIKTEFPADPHPPFPPKSIWSLCRVMVFARACARADTPLENVFVRVQVPPSVCYILHNDADISNTASRRVPWMFGSQQDGRKGKYFNMRRRERGREDLADLCCECVCVHVASVQSLSFACRVCSVELSPPQLC